MDQGTIASNGVNGVPSNGTVRGRGIQGDFNLNNSQDGFLPSSYLIGFGISVLIVAICKTSGNRLNLIQIGLVYWMTGVALCGFSNHFQILTISRIKLYGSQYFIALHHRALQQAGKHMKWRKAFRILSLLMSPLFFLSLFIEGPRDVEICNEEGTCDQEPKNFKSQIKLNFVKISQDMKLICNKNFILNNLGLIVYTFVLGAYSFWGPKAGYILYHMNNADNIFGIMTLICGVLGTILGGFLLHHLGDSIKIAFKIQSFATYIGAFLCLGAFFTNSTVLFIGLFGIGEISLFVVQGVTYYNNIHCVPPQSKSTAMGISQLVIHTLGDVISFPLVGDIQDWTHNWKTTCVILTSAIFWSMGIFVSGDTRRTENTTSTENTRGELTSSSSSL
ncbi:hypothetical protein F8388_011946 [Cannabis sativa]|uniref:Major facilitator superfamily (MFS) profile domain-containing protein n=1 Tax=Cannabis sativa TaxID=3483 RepID=A0A7J6GDL7_CANSA|nr:hypothetical protein F8388_011946 [Cannabis sativa]